jgi:uncharacterized cupin superfamily protein
VRVGDGLCTVAAAGLREDPVHVCLHGRFAEHEPLRDLLVREAVDSLVTVKRVNIAEPTFKYDDDDPEGFRSGSFRFGPLLEAQELGTTVYELPPGQSICPYHYEYAEEEWLIVLSGRPMLRHPEGSDQLDPWDVVCFARGPAGAHQVRNETDETVRVLMYSTVKHPAATVYPDSDKIAIWTGNRDDDVIVKRSSGVDYWVGETSA